MPNAMLRMLLGNKKSVVRVRCSEFKMASQRWLHHNSARHRRHGHANHSLRHPDQSCELLDGRGTGMNFKDTCLSKSRREIDDNSYILCETNDAQKQHSSVPMNDAVS